MTLIFQCSPNIFQINAVALSCDIKDPIIDEDVFSSEIYDNSKYLVCLWRSSISDSLIEKRLSSDYGYSTEIYENEDNYNSIIVPKLAKEVAEKYGYDDAFEKDGTLIDNANFVSLLSNEIAKDYDCYIMAKRNTISSLYSDSTSSFIKKHVNDSSDVIYAGTYTNTIILYASKEEIEYYATKTDVIRVSSYVDEIQEPSLFSVQNQIGTDSVTGTRSTLYNSGSGYRGTNVKIGILEAGAGRYNASATQLASIPSTQLQYVANQREDGTYITPTVSTHATMVTTLIVGQAVTGSVK